MAEPSDTKLDPAAEQAAAAEPKLASTETELATNPKSVQEDSKEAEGGDSKTYTEKASEAATSAATGMKANVFSMFGGGAKKEKKEDTEEAGETSGSAKAQKEKEDEVCVLIHSPFVASRGPCPVHTR